VTVYQALLLFTIFAVPIWLMAKRDGDLLLLWLIAVICTDIFNVRSVVNVSAASVAGLLLVPYSARVLLASRRAAPVSWAAAHWMYLVLLGLAFGFAFPWPDTIGRPFNLQAPGRTMLYLMRETAALSIAVFVGQQVAKAGRPDRLMNGILIAGLATSAFALLEYATGVSYFLLFSEGVAAPTYWNLRVRGLNFEPRGFGLVGAHALVLGILFVAHRRLVRVSVATVGTTAAAMFLSASTSGFIATAGGVGAASLSHHRVRRQLVRAVAALLIICGAIAAADWRRVEVLQNLVAERVGTTARFGAARDWFQEVVYRMEIFDTAATLFLAANPTYLIMGTGPGLVSLPATPFLPISRYTRDYVRPGINSPPTMGWLLELSNGGFVTCVLWVGFVLSASGSLKWAVRHAGDERRSWMLAHWSFLAAAAIYTLAAGFLTSCWTLFVGLGLGASFIRQRTVAQAAGES
jgi:hypothetical protein